MPATASSFEISLYGQALLRRLRWVTHPITIFVLLQIVWLAITLIWVIWFVGQQQAIAELAQKFGREIFDTRASLGVLVAGCVLLGMLLVGVISLFVIYQRQSYVARQQRTFVSSVTHELKSPLASLQLSFETMTQRELDGPTKKQMTTMIQSDIDRLRRLVDQILVAGRLDRGLPLEDDSSQSVPIVDLIANVRGKLGYLDPQLASRLNVACPAGLSVHSARAALTLVLSNLLENAIKYSAKDAPIDVTVLQDDRELLVAVRDRGLGLDQKDKRRIFKMFHRSESAVKKAIPGTGLGLYIVRSAVLSLGGRVWAESAGRNLGTTFYVSLPATTRKVTHA
jgi:signal transduction histidine kinase